METRNRADVEKIVKWIKNAFDESHGEYAIIGMSGGKDSTIAAELCKRALGANHVICVSIPMSEDDSEVKNIVTEVLHIPKENFYSVNIQGAFGEILSSICEFNEVDENKNMRINVPPRLRMTVLYAIATLYPCARVINTCNLSENTIGYFTKFGDGAGDLSIFGKLTCTEVVTLGDELGLPYELVHKVPADGLTENTDEDEFGFSYKTLDQYIRGEKTPCEYILQEIKRRIRVNAHKFKMPTYDPEE